ncbi:hypothetical protein KIPB_012751, partial [Kipferlia bialata]|eukprot:g12751.t1
MWNSSFDSVTFSIKGIQDILSFLVTWIGHAVLFFVRLFATLYDLTEVSTSVTVLAIIDLA